MSASRYVKGKGFLSLASVADRLDVTSYRLNSWYKHETTVFEVLIDGLVLRDMLKRVSI